MKKIVCRILPVLAIALVIAMVAGVAVAQEGETFSTNYFANNTASGAPPATLRFTEHGSVAHDECAMFYVFAADQQMTECCGCPVSANGLVEENVKTQLTANPLTGVIPPDGVIQVVSAAYPGSCDPTAPIIQPEIDTWMTHVQNKVGTAYPITETAGDEELLSSTETAFLEADCSFVLSLGSGQGSCKCSQEK